MVIVNTILLHNMINRRVVTALYIIIDICYTRYAAPGTRGSRLEYVQRVLVSYNTAAAAVRILQSRTSPFPFSISEASPAGFFLPLAQTHQKPGGKAI